MKRLLSFMLALVFCVPALFSCNNSDSVPAEEEINVPTTEENIPDDSGVTPEKQTKKMLAKTTVYTVAGEALTTETFEYDDNGRNIRIDTYSIGNIGFLGEENTVKTFTYNEKGELICERYDSKYTKNPARYQEIQYVYDEAGNLIKETVLQNDGGGDYSYYWEYEYDEEHRLLQASKKQGGTNVLTGCHTYTYAENSVTVIEETLSVTTGNPTMVITHNYVPSEEKPEKQTTFTDYIGIGINDREETVVYTYNEAGLLTKKEEISKEILDNAEGKSWISILENEYDANSNLVKSTDRFMEYSEYQKGNIADPMYMYTYKYDDEGNVIEKTYIDNGAIRTVTKYEYSTIEIEQ